MLCMLYLTVDIWMPQFKVWTVQNVLTDPSLHVSLPILPALICVMDTKRQIKKRLG